MVIASTFFKELSAPPKVVRSINLKPLLIKEFVLLKPGLEVAVNWVTPLYDPVIVSVPVTSKLFKMSAKYIQKLFTLKAVALDIFNAGGCGLFAKPSLSINMSSAAVPLHPAPGYIP